MKYLAGRGGGRGIDARAIAGTTARSAAALRRRISARYGAGSRSARTASTVLEATVAGSAGRSPAMADGTALG